MTVMDQKSIDKFHTHYAKGNEDECWMWQGTTAKPGDRKVPPYGVMRVYVDGAPKVWLAHRIMYFLTKGEFPEGKVIRHTCGVAECVNPDHIKAATRSEVIVTANWTKPIGGTHAGNVVTCPHCGVQGGQYVMNRWHMTKCKHHTGE